MDFAALVKRVSDLTIMEEKKLQAILAEWEEKTCYCRTITCPRCVAASEIRQKLQFLHEVWLKRLSFFGEENEAR